MVTARTFSDNDVVQGTSYFVDDTEVHFPVNGQPEVFVGQQVLDASQFAQALPTLIELFTDPVVCAEILRARANS